MNAQPISAVVGLSILVASAATQVASRFTLGRYSRFPVLPVSLTSQRPVHVPPSIADSMARSTLRISKPRPDGIDDAEEATCSLRSSHELVTDGPYGYVRHPMYSSLLFGGLGSTMFYSSSITPLATLFDAMLSLISRLPSQSFFDTAYITSLLDKICWRKFGLSFAVIALGITSAHLYGVACIEEEALQQRFGSRWKLYKWDVRSMLLYVPGI